MARSKYKVANMDSLPDEQSMMEDASISKKKYEKKVEDNEFGEGSLDTVEEVAVEAASETVEEEKPVAKKIGFRSKRYVASKAHIDRTKTYAVAEAVKLLKDAATAKFDETVEVHLVLKDVLGNVEVAYPHSTGRTIRVQIVTDEVLSSLDKGVIDFDILLATPAQMGSLTKFARLLGPKGLMPNPKNGTLISDPQKRKKELESGKVTVRGEKKAPLLHTTIGKISMDQKALVENISALLNACQGKALKAVVTTTMSPGVKIALQ